MHLARGVNTRSIAYARCEGQMKRVVHKEVMIVLTKIELKEIMLKMWKTEYW